jgi:phosphatidylglycerol:prolipoprotein diacylglycerol transferase
MLIYPDINPIALALGPFKIHWYGLLYLVGFALALGLGLYRAKRSEGAWTNNQVTDLIFYGAVGVILGGRFGYVIFYDFPHFLQDPLSLFKIWEGGMSFHGGLIGVILACLLFARHFKKNLFEVTDFIAPLVPLGLAAGRLGNFINGELWGRVTDMPWGMLYPNAGPLPRHPSQIYEFLLEGILFFIIIWIYSSKPKPRMAVSGVFLIGYGSLRFFAECFREPDEQLGFIAFNWMTQGQRLCLPMIALGIVLLYLAYFKKEKAA